MTYPFQDICKTPHRCQHRLGPWETYTTDYDSECVGGCKCGTNWNEFFQDKPTEAEAEEWAKQFYLKGLRAKQIAEDRKRNLFAEQQEAGQIITINFDHERHTEQQIRDIMMDCIANIRMTGYKWMDKDAIACLEFYSHTSPHAPKNPHIHLATKRMLDKVGRPIKATSIAQILRRKFSNLEAVYGVNGQERTWEIARNYVDGSCVSKSPGGDKWGYTEQDITYRLMHDLPHPIQMGHHSLENIIL